MRVHQILEADVIPFPNSKPPSPADKLRAKADDFDKRNARAQQYLDDKGVDKDDKTPKGPGSEPPKPTKQGVLKRLRGLVGKAGVAGIAFQLFLGYDKAVQQIEIYLKEYEAAGYDITNPRVIKAQKNLHDNISQTIIASMAAGLASATAMKYLSTAKKVKDFVQGLRLVGMAAGPVGWIVNILTFIGIEGAIYAISKVLSESETVQKYVADMIVSRFFTHEALIGGTPQGTDKFPTGSAGARSTTGNVYKKWNESFVVEQEASQQITKDAIAAFKGDEKLMAMYKKAKKEKAKAKAS